MRSSACELGHLSQKPSHPTWISPRGMTNASLGRVHCVLPVKVSTVSIRLHRAWSRRTVIVTPVVPRRIRQLPPLSFGRAGYDKGADRRIPTTLPRGRAGEEDMLGLGSACDRLVLRPLTTGSAIVTQKVRLHPRAGSSHFASASWMSIPGGRLPLYPRMLGAEVALCRALDPGLAFVLVGRSAL